MSIKEQAEEIRRELDALIGNDTSNPIERFAEKDPILPEKRPKQQFDFVELKKTSVTQAKKTINALMKFYLDEEIIEKDEYLQAKKKMDEMTMSSLVYQLQAGERALTTLLETIEDGEISPRMFEVLATLQRSMLDIIKSQTMYLMATEESAKRIAKDISIYNKRVEQAEIKEVSGGNSNETMQRGTRSLMQMIQQGIHNNTEDVEEIKPEDE